MLQELLASHYVIFYNCKWTFLRTNHTLSDIIEHQTGIDKLALRGKSLADYSIAQRMSWASRTITTRAEDIAYCLLGIFDVNMPMLYGEGTKAFMRRQEGIIKQSDDHSIFAWSMDERAQTGLLADSPAAFATCKNVEGFGLRTNHSAYAMTNRGLSYTFIAVPSIVDTYLVRLTCTDVHSLFMGIFVRRLRENDQYARVRCDDQSLKRAKAGAWDKTQINVNVRQRHAHSWDRTDHVLLNGFRISPFGFPTNLRFKVHGCEWDPLEREISFQPGKYYQIGVLDFSSHGGKFACLKLGFDVAYNPVCFLLANKIARAETVENVPILSLWIWRASRRKVFGSERRSTISTGVDMGRMSSLMEGLPGLWALKGDRLDGFKARLTSNSIEVLRGLNGVSIAIIRKEVHGGLVWDVRWSYSNVPKPEHQGVREQLDPQAHYTYK